MTTKMPPLHTNHSSGPEQPGGFSFLATLMTDRDMPEHPHEGI